MNDTAYRVLARKYRPQNFDDLIGQSTLVRTLTNAFNSGRIAHAFLLTGIRGIGKTTTARIIARGLNCLGADGNGGPTTSPCGVCSNCKMILEDRHVDVIEMDAASRTGVDDIRDIIDTVHYAPTSARYKIYIIDEVHMLSKNAFNALLKTLEEPPAHVKFIFATTELRKIPVTIISRCQRFDLRRLNMEELADHLSNISQKENVETDTESLKLIATAAEGSVRDALSLLDQAIALGAEESGRVVLKEETTRDMLGMTTKSHIFQLLERLMQADLKGAIEKLRDLYTRGSDPVLILQDVLELVHYMTRIQLSPDLANNLHYSDIEQQKAKELAGMCDITVLTRFWQMTLKGIAEVKQAPQPMAATEMILIRLGHASALPSPEELIRKMDSAPAPPSPSSAGTHNSGTASAGNLSTGAVSTGSASSHAPAAGTATAIHGNLALAAQHTVEPLPTSLPEAAQIIDVHRFEEAVALFDDHKEAILYSHLFNDVRLVSFQTGRIELNPVRHLPSDFAARVGRHLTEWTGKKWLINFSEEDGTPTLREQELKAQEERFAYAAAHPVVRSTMELFPGSEIVEVIQSDDKT